MYLGQGYLNTNWQYGKDLKKYTSKKNPWNGFNSPKSLPYQIYHVKLMLKSTLKR